ncbi:hypothetical protein H6G65_04495 [Microcystis elabens FACHB-917]|nr:hypothetical protein [Microcystis elabens FACHB-917]
MIAVGDDLSAVLRHGVVEIIPHHPVGERLQHVVHHDWIGGGQARRILEERDMNRIAGVAFAVGGRHRIDDR